MKQRRLRVLILVLPMLALFGSRVSGDDEDVSGELKGRIARLEAENRVLTKQVMAEQQRHTRDVEMLHGELARANERLEANRIQATLAESKLAVLRAEMAALRVDAAQARAELVRAGPRASVQAVFGHVMVSTWLDQLAAKEKLQRDIALAILEVRLPGTLAKDSALRARAREALTTLSMDASNPDLAARAKRLGKTLEAE